MLLWQGQFVSQLGSSVSGIALSLWVVNTTNSGTILGTLMMIAAIPGLILQPLGGSIADRFSRKRIIVTCDLVYGVLAVLLGASLFLLSSNLTGSLIPVFVLHVLMSAIGALFVPAVAAFTPSLVPKEHIASANALTQSTAQVAGLIGRAAGGILYRILGAPILFLVDGITFIISAVSELFIQSPQDEGKSEEKEKASLGLMASTKEGFAYVWQWKGLRVLMLVAAALNFFITPVFILLPFYVKDPRYLAAGDEWYGFLLASMAPGSLVGFSVGAILFVGSKCLVK